MEKRMKFPRRVKLADGPLSVLILGLPAAIFKQYWPLDFNSQGGPMLESLRVSTGFDNWVATIP